MRPALWRVRGPEWIVGLASAALLIVLFVASWYGATPTDGFHSTITGPRAQDGWQSLSILGPLSAIVGVLGLVVWSLQLTCRGPALPSSATVCELLLSFALSVGLVIRLISPPALGAGTTVDVRFGAYAGCGLALTVLAGSFRSMRVEGIPAADGPQTIELIDVNELISTGSPSPEP